MFLAPHYGKGNTRMTGIWDEVCFHLETNFRAEIADNPIMKF
jgi:hypothetical protein